MKILALGSDKDLLKPGSVSYLRHQAYAKQFEELHLVVFARRKYGGGRIAIGPNAWAYPTNARGVPGLFYNAYRIGRRILKEPGKWVISAQDPFEAGVVGWLLARTTNTRLLIQEHGDFFSQPYWRHESLLNTIRYRLGKILIHKANRMRAVSERIAATIEHNGVPKEQISVVPVYTDTTPYIEAEASSVLLAERTGDQAIILSVARFVPQKNLSLLVRAFSKLETRTPAHLVIVGEGPEEGKLKQLANELAPDRITFLPWTDNVPGYMKAADIYALSSNYEGWGRVCVEALAAGTSLIMTDVGCVGEVVHNDKNGLVVPVADEATFTAALARLVDEPTLRKRLAAEGQRTVAELPTQEEYIERYKKSLESCIVPRYE